MANTKEEQKAINMAADLVRFCSAYNLTCVAVVVKQQHGQHVGNCKFVGPYDQLAAAVTLADTMITTAGA